MPPRDPSRRRRIRTRVGLIILAVLVAAVAGFLVWAGTASAATDAEFAEVAADPAISLTETPQAIVLAPTGAASGTGLVFIPGARVEAEAYANKLSALVADGTTVVITRPILNLAFFDLRPLSTFTDLAPDVDSWLIGGHSLGGVKACLLAEDPAIDGLVLFGSYCANDLSGSGLPVLSIGGSEDGLSTPAQIEENAGNLPQDAEFVTIDGANHAAFGDYGPQAGDGTATLKSDEVRARLTELVTGFITESTGAE